jgi:hypothetical protein
MPDQRATSVYVLAQGGTGYRREIFLHSSSRCRSGSGGRAETKERGIECLKISSARTLHPPAYGRGELVTDAGHKCVVRCLQKAYRYV